MSKNETNIKMLCLANGDCFENIVISMNEVELKEAIEEGKVITVEIDKKTIMINSEFIVSYEIRENQKLSSI